MNLTNPEGKRSITLKDGEVLDIHITDFEPGSRTFSLEIILEGEGASCSITGRAQSLGNDEKIWDIRQIYRGKDQVGSIELRGTAEDESFLQFDGSAILEQSSVDAEADISERIILFDEGQGKLLPVLRVETDQVKAASHGASIAPVEAEKLLYLASRGISKKEGEQMVKEGFLSMNN